MVKTFPLGTRGDRKALAAAIRPIYTAASAEAAQAELDAFSEGPWDQKFPTIRAAWRSAWDRVIPFFAFPPEVRRAIYTTNAIESISAQLLLTPPLALVHVFPQKNPDDFSPGESLHTQHSLLSSNTP